MELVKRLVSGKSEVFPEGALTMEEKCSLHWMLSYSVNTTFREEEAYWTDEYEESRHNNDNNNYHNTPYPEARPPYGSNAWGAPSDRPPYDCVENQNPRSFAPWEMGVLWSPTGPVSAGTLMAGLAAGMQPQIVNWQGSMVENGWGVSLAGDLAQTALLKRRDESYTGPDGYFNSTVCPAAFYQRNPTVPGQFSRLTVAEINGGIDGLLLSMYSPEWERNSEFTLSQILDLYYSNLGIKVAGATPLLLACDRYANYFKLIPADKLSSQALAFGRELRTVMVVPFDDASLRVAIGAAKTQLDTDVTILDQTLNDFGPCVEQRERDGYTVKNLHGYEPSPIDRDNPSSGIADLAIVLDSSIYSEADVAYERYVAAAITNELDIWTTSFRKSGIQTLIDGGSFVEVSEGKRGDVVVKGDNCTNKAQLACQIIDTVFPSGGGDLDPTTALERVASRMYSRQLKLQEENLSAGRALVILLVIFGRVETGDQSGLNDAVYRLRRYYPNVHLLIATRWAPGEAFVPYVMYPEFDIFVLEQYDEELREERDGRRIAARVAQIAGAITFSVCKDEYAESRLEEVLQLVPNTQRFLQVQPKYFHQSKQLTIEFDVKHNGAEICWSRASPEEHNSMITTNNKATSKGKSNYKPATEADLREECRSSTRISFEWKNPCGDLSVTKCRPIYFKLTGKDSGGLKCRTDDHFPCRTANAALVTLTHRGMTCGAMDIRLSMLVLAMALISAYGQQ